MLSKVIVLAFAVCVTNAATFFQNVIVPETGTVSFQSPNYPGQYPSLTSYSYLFEVATGAVLQFDTVDFSLENNCDYDYVTFYETIDDVLVNFAGPFCGNNGPIQVRSSTNVVHVGFNADSSVTSTGFKINVHVVRETPTTYRPMTTRGTTRRQTTRRQTTQSPIDTTMHMCSIVCRGNTPPPLTVKCSNGNLEFSEVDFQNTNALTATLTIDTTFSCRQKMYSAHSFLLLPQPKLESGQSESTSAICFQGKTEVSSEEPNDSDATTLTFTTAGNIQCRLLFVQLMQHLYSLQN